MQQNNHLVYLNMKQVKKEQNPDQKNEEKLNKVTKLAIGKPGGADFSGEEYELQLSVRCLACNITVDYEKNVRKFRKNLIKFNKFINFSTKKFRRNSKKRFI